jgi:uncharacterized protein
LIVSDTSFVLALIAARAPHHAEVAGWYAREAEPLVTTPLAIAELDYMLRRYTSAETVAGMYGQLESGGLGVTWWPEALDVTLRVARAREDIGLTDASLVALAAHLGTIRIATLDERHFRTIAPLTGEPAFTLLPADAD